MSKFTLLTLGATVLFAMSGGASAQYIYLGPGYGSHIEPRYERDYDERRHYREERRDYERSEYRGNCQWYRGRRICCPPHYTIQDGVCKPYRGY